MPGRSVIALGSDAGADTGSGICRWAGTFMSLNIWKWQKMRPESSQIMRSCSHARGFWPPSCRGGELRGDSKSGGGAMGSAP